MREAAVIPDILTNSIEELRDKVGRADQFAKRVHIDVIDGIFVKNKTVMPDDLHKVDWGDLAVDIQLMVDEPSRFLPDLTKVKQVRVIGHIERMENVEEFISVSKKMGMLVGLGLNLETEIEKLTDLQLKRAEVVLLMSVPVGFSGQKFDESVLVKIVALRQRGFEGDIVIDGGMNEETILQCLRVGANQFAVNSALWQTDNVINTYQQLEEMVTAHEYRTQR